MAWKCQSKSSWRTSWGTRVLLGEHPVDQLDGLVAGAGEQGAQLVAQRQHRRQLGLVAVVATGVGNSSKNADSSSTVAEGHGLERTVGQHDRGLERDLDVMSEYHVDRLPHPPTVMSHDDVG